MGVEGLSLSFVHNGFEITEVKGVNVHIFIHGIVFKQVSTIQFY